MTTSPLNAAVRDQLARMTAGGDMGDAGQLNNALRLLSKWRSVLIQNTLLRHQGTVVLEGAVAGLDFLPQSAEGCHVAKLLGCYEQPLQPHIEAAIAEAYPTILNIGCAEGYYAVGMARRMPGTAVIACDTNPAAQQTCRELADKNGVAARVTVSGHFESADFARYAGGRVLVLCDIEGGEQALLDPVQAPALRGMDIIMESHDCIIPGITKLMIERFSESHEIVLVEDDGQRQLSGAAPWFKSLAHLDQLLATWEWRAGPTPWLVMRVRRG